MASSSSFVQKVAALQDDVRRRNSPFYEEESSSFVPPTSTHDAIRVQRLIASRLGFIDRNTTQPRDEEQGIPQSQADAEATTTATHMVNLEERTENVDDAGVKKLDTTENVRVSNSGHLGTSRKNERQRNWQRRLKTNMRRLANVNVRDIVSGLQILTLVALVILLLTTSHTVGSMNMKLFSERNEDELNEALTSITSMTGLIENVTRRVQTVADDVADFSSRNATQDDVQQGLKSAAKIVESIGSVAENVADFSSRNATQDDVQQGLKSAAKIVESIGSVAEDVNHYTRKQTTQDDFDDVLRKLGKLIDKGLDQFE
jgi:hypothetical protein